MDWRRNSTRTVISGISGGIFLIGLAIAIVSGHFLPVLFITLAITSLLGSISSFNPNGLYGGLFGFLWMLILALFFITGSPIWFLVGAGISAILSALRGPIIAAIIGMGILGTSSMANQPPPQQTYYQPPQPEQPYQPYQQGYQTPAQPQESYQEEEQQYQYPPSSQPQEQGWYQQPEQPQYEVPQAQYPQEMPPQQQ